MEQVLDVVALGEEPRRLADLQRALASRGRGRALAEQQQEP
jgi:hypothetical protein